MMATIDPIKSTISEGFAYRRAVDGPPSRLVLIGIWAIFLPAVLLPRALLDADADWISRTFSGLGVILAAAILYRATANYLRKRAPHSDAEATGDEGREIDPEEND